MLDSCRRFPSCADVTYLPRLRLAWACPPFVSPALAARAAIPLLRAIRVRLKSCPACRGQGVRRGKPIPSSTASRWPWRKSSTNPKRRARRATSSALPCFNGAVVLHDGQGYMPGGMRRFSPCFNGAVVLHDGQVAVCANHHDGGHLRASTEPSFFTTDKSCSACWRSCSAARRFNGAVVLHDGQVKHGVHEAFAGIGFNGAVVLHDGQVAIAAILSALHLAGASTEPSFFTTDKEGRFPVLLSFSSELQRSRRSSRRTSCRISRCQRWRGLDASTEPSFFTTDKR